MSETIRVPRSGRNRDSSFWGIIEVDRTRLYIRDGNQDRDRDQDKDRDTDRDQDRDTDRHRDRDRHRGKDRDSERGEQPAGSHLEALPVMDVPGGPGLRNGWSRRDSEGEIVVRLGS
jgi:hypothetical protein